MLGKSLLLLVFLLAGAAVQLAGAPTKLRDAVWVVFFWTFSPVLVFVTFSTVDLNEGLGRALAAAILASWLVGLTGYAYAPGGGRAGRARRADPRRRLREHWFCRLPARAAGLRVRRSRARRALRPARLAHPGLVDLHDDRPGARPSQA